MTDLTLVCGCKQKLDTAEGLEDVATDSTWLLTSPDSLCAASVLALPSGEAASAYPILPGLNGPWYAYPGTSPRYIYIYVDSSFHSVRITGKHTASDCFGDACLAYGRVCPIVFARVFSPQAANLRVYGVPLGDSRLSGGHGSAHSNGNLFVATTFNGRDPFSVYHGVIIVQHEIGHRLITMSHVAHKCLMNGAGNFLPIRYHASNALIKSVGLAGFSGWAIGQLQQKYGNRPYLWRES